MFSIPCKQQCLCVQLQLALSSEQLVSTELRPEGLLQGGRTVVETPHSFPGCWGVSLWNKQTRCWLLNTTSIHVFFQTPASSLSLLWQPAAAQRIRALPSGLDLARPTGTRDTLSWSFQLLPWGEDVCPCSPPTCPAPADARSPPALPKGSLSYPYLQQT